MDGYTAFGASITKDGQKQTLSCPAPKAVLADLDVLVGAPKDMTASGYADLLGKVTAGADWIIADALGVEPINKSVWSLVQDPLRGWISDPAGLRAGNMAATEALVEGLILSGLAMQAYQSSRPASGAEHQFSHLWEMEGLGREKDPPLSHGFKVGVGSVAIAALYERVLERDLGNLDVDALSGARPSHDELEASVREAHTVPEVEAAAVKESLAKHPDPDALAARLETLRGAWPELRERLTAHLMPAAELRGMLQEAGCPTTPEEIGLGRQAFEATYTRARTIRRRYTVLDLAAEAGILRECVAELFYSGGFWSGTAIR
jgi:glycerol-1-phosphate dehydrogenase [NAD(P)+]